MSYDLITCIIERGRAERIIDTALKNGAQAATYFNGRGRGVREKLGVLGKFISPEKEIILIVTKSDQTGTVFGAIATTGQLQLKGKGFAYVQKVEQAVGFINEPA